MKLGIMIEGQEGLNWDQWVLLIDAAEDLGFDSLWRSDHLFSVMGESYRETLGLIPSLTAVAQLTERIEFGQLVSPTTFRHPVHLATESAAIDQLADGRSWLGMGAGWNFGEHEAFGFPLLPVGERMDRFEEALQVVKKLGSGEEADFAGKHFQLSHARLTSVSPRPSGVRLMLGGSGEKRTLRLVAQFADEWNATLCAPDVYVHKTGVLEQHCAAVGRDPGEISRSMMIGIIAGSDDAEVRKRAAEVQQIIPMMRGETLDDVMGIWRERGWLMGTPTELVAAIQAREAQGIQRIMLQNFLVDDIDQLELLAADVLPQVS